MKPDAGRNAVVLFEQILPSEKRAQLAGGKDPLDFRHQDIGDQNAR